MWVSSLDPEASERLRRLQSIDAYYWWTHAAQYAPIVVPQDRPLTDAESAALIADLQHTDPWVRMLAIRSVPRGSMMEVRAALVKRVWDPYEEHSGIGCGSGPLPVLPYAMVQAAVRLGPEMIESLLAAAPPWAAPPFRNSPRRRRPRHCDTGGINGT